MTAEKTLADLRVGDWVSIWRRGPMANSPDRMVCCSRITAVNKKTVSVAWNNGRYLRSNGRPWPSGFNWIMVATPEHLAEWEDRCAKESAERKAANELKAKREARRAALGWRMDVMRTIYRLVDDGADIETAEKLGEDALVACAKALGIKMD